MAINTIAYADIFQKNLDKVAVEELLTGWMDGNAGQVIYNGGSQVKIPKMTVQGLGTYSRDNGYVQGGVTLSYEQRSMTQDRGRKFQLDAMDINEANFVPTASVVMGEFQRTMVVPEIDAYRLSQVITTALTSAQTGQVEYGYTPASATALAKLKAGIAYVRDCGYTGSLVCHASGDFVLQLELALGAQLRETTFANGGIDTRVPVVDDVPIIRTPKNRMYSKITLYDGSSTGQTGGGYIKHATDGLDCNFVIMPADAPIAVTKQDVMKIFTPEQNQDADAWKMNYRRYHDLWVMDNKAKLIFANIKDSEPQD